MKIIIIILLSGCFNLIAAELFYAAANKPVAPVMDGRLDDECWQKIVPTAAFVQVNGKPSSVKTTARMLVHSGNLYVGFSCGEPTETDLKALLKEKALRDFDDSIELFLEPEKGNAKYYQFMLALTGKKYTGSGTTRKLELDKYWSGVVSIRPGGWNAELKIPLNKFGIKPDVAIRCGLNLNRNCALSKESYSCWSPTFGGFHNPSRFGNLIFSSYSRWLRSRLSTYSKKFKSSIMRLKKKYPESLNPSMSAVSKLLKKSDRIINNLKNGDISKKGHFGKIYAESIKLEKAFSAMLEKIRLTIINNEYGK